MLRTAARRIHTTVSRSSAFADFPLPKDVPLVAPAPVSATAQVASGLRTGAVDTHGPTSSLVLVVPAGARAESSDNLGAAHFLANFAYKYTATQTPVKLAREIEMRGMKVSTTADREFIVYQAEFLRDDLAFAVETLSDVVYNTAYNHWEFKEVAARTAEQAAAAAANATLVGYETAHRIAFRHGLGNATTAPVFNTVSADKVKAFAQSHLSIGSGAALFGVGVNPEELQHLATAHFDQTGASPAAGKVASKYFGGESRVELARGHNVTVAFPGAAAYSQDAATLAVLTTLLGDGTKYVKWGEAGSPLVRAGREAHAAVRAFSATYSDAGLFGLSSTCKTSPANAAKGIATAVAALKRAADGVAADEFARAVNQAKAAQLFAQENKPAHARAAAQRLAISGKAAASSTTAIEEVSAEAVAAAAQRLLAAKPTIVAAGKTVDLPYADNLGL
ncbi:ubiquinol-cytochrome c reductase core subunit 1 [Blastocladiella emersonii ATCC 22665]|nr:ubiquinol-cytochrome c reductase core subunit 1 [Blastocladiella emersonii ATCC 22665]